MFQSTKLRYYSTKISKSDLDKKVDLRNKVERYAKLWQIAYEDPKRTYKDLKGYLRDENLWFMAYQKIAKNRGSTTPSVNREDTIDRVNVERIREIIKQVLAGEYRWKPTKRVHILKADGKSKRPLGIPSFSDKLVETVLYMILEPIYEFGFDPNSFGFRPEKSAHTALKYIATKCKSARWVIEGDISKCFDIINHDLLIKILKEKIQDDLIIGLVEGSLKTEIYDGGKLLDESPMGTRQGGILSPLLCNILLDKLDKKVREWEDEILRNNPEAHTLKPNNLYYDIHRKKLKGEIPRDTKNPYPQKDRRRTRYEKIWYVRYADDFILFCDTSLEKAWEYKEKLSSFIRDLNLELNETKTKITNTQKGYKFLGHRFVRMRVRTERGQNVSSLHILGLFIDIPQVIKALMARGFCNAKGFPIEHPGYINRTQVETNSIINMVLNGYREWFNIAENRQRSLSVIETILKLSIAKTYAAKYRIRTISQVFKKAGKKLEKPLRSDYRTLGLTEENVEYQKSKREIPPIGIKDYPPFQGGLQKWSLEKPTYLQILETKNWDTLCDWIVEGRN